MPWSLKASERMCEKTNKQTDNNNNKRKNATQGGKV